MTRSWTWAAALSMAVGLQVGAVRGQSVGFGASPGRASYRPAGQWNDGPFYTVPHVTPYAPRAAVDTGLMYNEAQYPPYTNGPHAQYGAFAPAQGALYPYSQGFSPYSGYAGWYKQTHQFQPTNQEILAARRQFYRSGGPYVPPSASGYRPNEATPAVTTPAPRRQAAATPKARVGTPVSKPAGAGATHVPIYRSSVSGSP